MKQEEIIQSDSRRNILRAIFFIAAIVALIFCLPREASDEYTYVEGRPWTYSLLTAPFDIPVHLDSASTRRVKDSIDADFEPVYIRDVSLEKAMVSEFGHRLNTRATTIPPAMRNRILASVRKIYDDGLVDANTYARIAHGELPSVKFIHDNMAISMPTESYLSGRVAYLKIDSILGDDAYRRVFASIQPADLLQPNIIADTTASNRLLAELYQQATAPVGVIQQGERIIDKGDIVTPRLATVLDTYTAMMNGRDGDTATTDWIPLMGQVLFLFTALGSIYMFLYVFRPDYWRSPVKICFLMALPVAFSFLAYTLSRTFTLGIYLVPFTIVPILTVIFMDSRTALFVHVVMILICALLAVAPMEFIFIQFIGGTIAIDSIKDLSRRSQLIKTAALVFVGSCVAYVAIELMLNGHLDAPAPTMFGYLAINAVMVSFAYILLFFCEKIFGFTSRVTLVELSDINNPLLRKLSEECPGTFQHSMAISNLASAAASAIGANVQMVRAGALYHDIGKIANPAFFTENQHGVNPHDTLQPQQSARIVINHVYDGLKMADKGKLPPAIRDFIAEHHGRGMTKYFYNTWCNAHPDEKPDTDAFRYPGPNPRSRETSVLMMADAVEAASRSMTDHSTEAITSLVDKIIDGQIADGLHNDSPISFRDVNKIKEVFVRRLGTLYHTRITYPDLNKTQQPS